jgi:4'-phosphopantetheinyl transferase
VTASTATAWAHGPLRPRLAEGAVHVWRADLAAVLPELGDLLCEEERARAARILNEHDGELWRRSRGVLRALLGRYLQRDPSSLRFATGEHGKPALIQNADELAAARQPAAASPDRLAFNMSHSGALALYAFTRTGTVGVDVEVEHRPIDAVAIAARMLGPAEAQRLGDLSPAIRQREFLRSWVRYEAKLKCLGVGIGGAPVEGGESVQSITALDLGSNAAGAVATQHQTHELRCWEWQA